MKVCILGNTGYIGGKLRSYFESEGKHDLYLPIRGEHEDMNGVDLVINCIGRVGSPNLDEYDSSQIMGEAIDSNVAKVAFFTGLCEALDIPLIHLSTGCFFKGDDFFEEHEFPNFLDNGYVKSKRDAENILMDSEFFKSDNIAIIRFRMPFDGIPHPKNLLCKYLSYETLHPCVNSMTYIPHFCEAVHMLVDANQEGNKIGGIYHFINPYPIDTTLTAKAIKHNYGIDKPIRRMQFLVERSECTLSNAQSSDKFKSFGKSLPFTKCYDVYLESWKSLKRKGHKP
tara:strand:- start:4501 stop:5352 length:852 start_codon:yes stop_codon:yes gene_type:complete